jgi:hypothetical protein
MANRFRPTLTFTFSNVTAGASANLNSALGISSCNIVNISVTQDSGASSFDYKVYKSNTFAANEWLAWWKAVPGNVGLNDGADISGVTPTAALEAFVLAYDDDDGTGLLHHQITNNDVVAHTYTAVIELEDSPKSALLIAQALDWAMRFT